MLEVDKYQHQVMKEEVAYEKHLFLLKNHQSFTTQFH